MREQAPQILGAAAQQVASTAPWLPGALLFLGKCRGDIGSFTRILLEQANCMLLDPIEMPPETTFHLEPMDAPDGALGLGRSEIAISSPNNEDPNDSRRVKSSIKDESYTDRCCWTIHHALQQLARERGGAVLILDALDELYDRTQILDAVPLKMDVGVHAILTGRDEVIAKFVQPRQGVSKYSMDNLIRKDLPLILGLSDEVVEEREFMDEAHKRSKGLALAIRETADNLSRADGNISLSLIATLEELWRKHLGQWESHESEESMQLLEELLPLFVIFEFCSGLKGEEIQSYLRSLGIKKKWTGIKRALFAVQSQLTGDSSHLKLQNRGFAEHCLSEGHLTKQDIRDSMLHIVEWLGDSSVASKGTVRAFLALCQDDSGIVNLESAGLDEELLCRLSDRDSRTSNELRVSIGESLCRGDDGFKKNADRGRMLLELAVEAGDHSAMRVLGRLLCEGT